MPYCTLSCFLFQFSKFFFAQNSCFNHNLNNTISLILLDKLNKAERLVYTTQSSRYEGVFDDNFSSKPYVMTPSSEPSRQDSSDQGSQHMVLFRIYKNYPLLSPNTPFYLELCYGNITIYIIITFKAIQLSFLMITHCECHSGL